MVTRLLAGSRPKWGQEMTLIDIGVCTFKRPQIVEALQSIAQQSLPPDCSMRIIVADNDDTPSAKVLVESTAKNLGLNVTYIHAPARNISIARNACLAAATSDLFVFIDDDEQATPEWLKSLLSSHAETKANVVLGPVKAQYATTAPEWIREGDFHSFQPVWVNGAIITGYTSNVLFERTAPALKDKRFNLDLGRSGGEDTSFFSEAYKSGATFAYAPNAVVTEIVPAQRATFGWLLKRRFRSGQTHGLLLRRNAASTPIKRAKHLALAFTKASLCFAIGIGSFYKTSQMFEWILRGALHTGVISSLSGAQSVSIYGGTPNG